MKELIEAIRIKLNIPDNLFINDEIERYLTGIDPKDHRDFFADLSGDDFAYKSGMDRVAIVSQSYKDRKHALLNKNVKTKAKVLFDKLYALKAQVCDNYEHLKYAEIKLNNERYFTNAEMMVIDNLDMNALMRVIDTQSPSITEGLINHHMEKINKATAEGLAISLNDRKLIDG